MPRSLVGLGSNLGDRKTSLSRAVELLAAEASVSGVAISGFHETAPIGGPAGQRAFLNAAVALDTTLSPRQLHHLLRRIEAELGRQPAPRWASRPIDLDLLLYGDQIVNDAALSVPHPRMAFRRFVLAPAAEVARDMLHPLCGWTIGRLLAHLETAAPYVALLGTPDSERPALAGRVARDVGGSYLAAAARVTSADAAGDPSGLGDEAPIQFLDRVARLLQNRDWHSPQAATVSDFFLDECLAYARLQLDEVAMRRFRDKWANVRKTVVAPKLLVVLDTWEHALWVRSGGSAPAARELQVPPAAVPPDRLRVELLALANRENQGPVLYAGRNDPQAQLREITAAIAAMG